MVWNEGLQGSGTDISSWSSKEPVMVVRHKITSVALCFRKQSSRVGGPGRIERAQAGEKMVHWFSKEDEGPWRVTVESQGLCRLGIRGAKEVRNMFELFHGIFLSWRDKIIWLIHEMNLNKKMVDFQHIASKLSGTNILIKFIKFI